MNSRVGHVHGVVSCYLSWLRNSWFAAGFEPGIRFGCILPMDMGTLCLSVAYFFPRW